MRREFQLHLTLGSKLLLGKVGMVQDVILLFKMVKILYSDLIQL